MSIELLICLATIFVLAGIGTPIGYSILIASVAYLGLAGLDIALAGEKILQGFYTSTILLAVPLFIVAANIMNAGTITDRLLGFCVAAVGRFRGGLGHVNVVASLIFSGMSGSAVADAAGNRQDHYRHDDQGRSLQPWLCGRDHGCISDNRTHYTALDPDGAVCPGVESIDRCTVSCRNTARPDHGYRLDGHELLPRKENAISHSKTRCP